MEVILDNKNLLAANHGGGKSALVLFGGQMPKNDRWLNAIRDAEFLAAADGGAALALQLKRVPDLLIGDFDSLAADDVAACQKGGAEMVRLPVMKDETDGEFLLNTLLGRGFKQLTVLGALGGRPDMEFANIYCAEAAARRGATILLAHDNALLLPLFAEDKPCRLLLRGFAGYTFSQLSLSDCCQHIKLRGFLYPLDGALRRGQSLGLSNVIEENETVLTLEGGSLLTAINLF